MLPPLAMAAVPEALGGWLALLMLALLLRALLMRALPMLKLLMRTTQLQGALGHLHDQVVLGLQRLRAPPLVHLLPGALLPLVVAWHHRRRLLLVLVLVLQARLPRLPWHSARGTAAHVTCNMSITRYRSG